jgi:drug/metabolite transporter (DMT)-like permease
MKRSSHLSAVGFALVGFTSWVFGDTLMKLAGEADLPPYEVVAFLSLFGALMMTVKGAAQGNLLALWPRRPRRQLLRIVLSLGCSMANAVALKHLPLTLFYTAVFTAPMIIALLSVLFLREHLTPAKIIAIMVGFAGVVVAIDPIGSLTQGDWTGYAAAFVSVLCFSVSIVWLRLITQSETSDSIAFFTGLVGTALCGGLTAWHGAPVNPSMLLLLLVMAFFVLVGNLCSFAALRLATAATVSQFHYTQIVAGSVLGFLIWHDVPALNTVLGAAIIIASGLYIAARGGQMRGTAAFVQRNPETACQRSTAGSPPPLAGEG